MYAENVFEDRPRCHFFSETYEASLDLIITPLTLFQSEVVGMAFDGFDYAKIISEKFDLNYFQKFEKYKTIKINFQNINTNTQLTLSSSDDIAEVIFQVFNQYVHAIVPVDGKDVRVDVNSLKFSDLPENSQLSLISVPHPSEDSEFHTPSGSQPVESQVDGVDYRADEPPLCRSPRLRRVHQPLRRRTLRPRRR